ncbi:MAG: hypothetical protein ACT4P5_16410 [Armatimonadota bacterium]
MNRAIASTILGACIALAAMVPPPPALAQVPVMPQPPAQPVPPGPPVRPAPAPQPAADPRLAQLRAALERANLRVGDVAVTDATTQRPHWWGHVGAEYTQPSARAVYDQAHKIWWAMITVLAQEPPGAVMCACQSWNKYVIQVLVEVGHYSAFLKSYQAARTDAERTSAFDQLDTGVSARVFDLERRQFVDVKDFVNKNYTR